LSWPTTRDQINAVIVTFVAGYGAASAVPQYAKTAVKHLIGLWYLHREPDEEKGIYAAVNMLLSQFAYGGYSDPLG
jgi:hypothetical protein